MHDELIPMTDRIPQKMLTITRFDSMKSAPISPPISMKRKFNGVDRSYYSPQLTSSDVSSNEEHLEEDEEETMPRAASYILKNGSLKGTVGKLNAAEISLPSPPSSTASSLDNDHATSDSFLSNGDFCSFDSDIVLEGCKMSPEEEHAFQNDIRAVLNDLVEKTVEESIQDEIWAAVKINFDGETILPNGHRLNRGVAVMEYQRDIEPRFTSQLNYLKNILQKNILRYKAATPFLNPVDSVALKIPHYYQIVREPMDLTTIKHRLNFLWYRNAKECIADLRLILDNCFKFNAPQDFVYKSGKRFEEFLNDKLKDMPEEEVECPCPARPNPEEYFKEKDTRPFKRVDPILQENASRMSLTSTQFSTPQSLSTPVGQPTSKYTTRSVRGLKLKKPTKDLTTYTEAAAAVTPETAKPKYGKKIPLNDALKWCHEFVKELFTKKHVEYAWPFYKPVDLKQFPDYLRSIKSPIDLTTIKNRIETGGYETVGSFATAMRLMFSNCIRYNPPESPIIEQARKLRDHFELRFANIPEEFLKMRLEIPSKSTPSSSRNVSPCPSRSKISKIETPYISPQLPSVEKSSKKRKEKDRDDRRDSKKLKRSSSSYEKSESLPPASEGQIVKLEELQLQINTLTLALRTALQGGGATQEAKKLLNLVTQGAVPTVPVTIPVPSTPKIKKEKSVKGKRGPKPKQSRQRHLSSSESESEHEAASTFHPAKMEDLKKLKDDLENLPASDAQNLFNILRGTEPSLKIDEANIEIDFQTLSPQTLIKLRKFVDSVNLNIVKARSSGSVPSYVKRFCGTPTNVCHQTNIINDCDNNLSRAGSRASNLQLSEESSSDSEIDD